MNSYYKEATVGALVIVGVLTFLGGSLWLRGSSWDKSGLVPVLYQDIGNLKEGAPVRISGAPIGRVEAIQYLGVGRILVMLAIDRKKVTSTTAATASIVSVGMLGDAMIDYDPGQGTAITPADTLHGSMGGGDLMAVGARLADKAAQTLESLNRMLDTSLVVELRHTLRTSDRLLNYLADAKSGPTAELNGTLRAFQQTSARLDSTLAALDVKGLQANLNTTMQSADTTMRSVAKLTDQLTATTGRMDALLADIQSGKGTLGKLASDSGLYVDIRKTLDATTALINELTKHPGKIGITVRIP